MDHLCRQSKTKNEATFNAALLAKNAKSLEDQEPRTTRHGITSTVSKLTDTNMDTKLKLMHKDAGKLLQISLRQICTRPLQFQWQLHMFIIPL